MAAKRKTRKMPALKPSKEKLLYIYAASLVGDPKADPSERINPDAQTLLMRTFLATADLAGDAVTIKLKVGAREG
jgi:hypothetical protein